MPVFNISKDTEIGSSNPCIIRYHSMDLTKEETRRRRRRRSNDSEYLVPLENTTRARTSSDTIDRGSSAHEGVVLTPSEDALAQVSVDQVTTTPSPAEANSDTRRHTGKRRASAEMIHHEEESKTMQPATPRVQDEIRSPDIPERAVVSPAVRSSNAEQSPKKSAQGNESHTPATLPLRVSTRRTTTTTRWSPSMTGGREHASRSGVQRAPRGSQRSRGSASPVTPPARPISNATRNITFDMLQPHFERPLQHAADSFGVCTTLLKKICRRNGISNWPYRKICGLRKSIASMAKQVNYFDGEQKRAYADQLEKLEQELQAYLRTGNEPTEEFLQTLHTEAASAEQLKNKTDAHTAEIGNENEEKEAQVVPAWTTRPSIAPPQVQLTHSPHELHRRLAAGMDSNAWSARGPPLQASAFPTIATHHRALPSIASILQHQSYSSPSRAAATQNSAQYETGQQQQPQWRYFPPSNDDAV